MSMANVFHIKHRDELLRQVAEGLGKAYLNSRVANLKVTLCVRREVSRFGGLERYEFSLPEFLDIIARDTYWDARGDWSDAHAATVETF